MNRGWLIPIIVALVLAFAVALVGGTITDLGPWYEGLRKPDWTPPRTAFPIVWTTIFTLCAISAVTAWRAAPGPRQSDMVIGLFALNGFLNILWSLLFFKMQRPDWAMIELVALWISIAILIAYCWRLSRLAGVLLVPYLVWVTIAGLLNWHIVRLNAPFG